MSKRVRPGNPKVAIAYLRCSTTADLQALGLAAQRQAIVHWAARENVTIAAWFTEEVSGGAPLDRRPVLLQALAEVAVQGAGVLVVHRLDRFSREPLTAALAEVELRRHGATLACADGAGSGEDPTSELVRGILLSVARFEKAMIRARIKAALAVKMSKAERVGSVPYGKRLGEDGRTLVHDERESEVLELTHALRAEGMSLRQIVEELEQRGVANRAGRPFTVTSVARMVA